GDNRGALDPYSLGVTLDGRLVFHVENASGQVAEVYSPNKLPVGSTIHVAGTLNSATGELAVYVGGARVASLTTAVRPFRDLDQAQRPGLGIGGLQDGSLPYSETFGGLVDEVRVSKKVLTPAEFLNSPAATGGYQYAYGVQAQDPDGDT